jgi:g-D-glutamyl-meso-diaminopimelate peptidase
MELLIEGSRGEAVISLQKILTEIGYPIEINGVFCPDTTQAVMDFQRSVSIQPDGTVGDITWAFLLNVQAMKARS